MQLRVRSVVGLLAALAVSACVSRPDPRQPPEVLARIRAAAPPHFRAHLAYAAEAGSHPRTREEDLAEVRELLSASPWFASLDAGRDDADLLLSIAPVERTPYWHSPGHSPVVGLLTLALPIPWKEKSGYRMTATLASGASVELDTRREPRTISWSLAPLLNASPDRSFRASSERELARIHAQLLPLVEARP